MLSCGCHRGRTRADTRACAHLHDRAKAHASQHCRARVCVLNMHQNTTHTHTHTLTNIYVNIYIHTFYLTVPNCRTHATSTTTTTTTTCDGTKARECVCAPSAKMCSVQHLLGCHAVSAHSSGHPFSMDMCAKCVCICEYVLVYFGTTYFN